MFQKKKLNRKIYILRKKIALQGGVVPQGGLQGGSPPKKKFLKKF